MEKKFGENMLRVDRDFDNFSSSLASKFDEIVTQLHPQLRLYLYDIEDGSNPIIRMLTDYE
jgi:hypothetical protein